MNTPLVKGIKGYVICTQEADNRFRCGEPAQFEVISEDARETYCIHCLNKKLKTCPEIAVALLVECHKCLAAVRQAVS